MLQRSALILKQISHYDDNKYFTAACITHNITDVCTWISMQYSYE